MAFSRGRNATHVWERGKACTVFDLSVPNTEPSTKYLFRICYMIIPLRRARSSVAVAFFDDDWKGRAPLFWIVSSANVEPVPDELPACLTGTRWSKKGVYGKLLQQFLQSCNLGVVNQEFIATALKEQRPSSDEESSSDEPEVSVDSGSESGQSVTELPTPKGEPATGGSNNGGKRKASRDKERRRKRTAKVNDDKVRAAIAEEKAHGWERQCHAQTSIFSAMADVFTRGKFSSAMHQSNAMSRDLALRHEIESRQLSGSQPRWRDNDPRTTPSGECVEPAGPQHRSYDPHIPGRTGSPPYTLGSRGYWQILTLNKPRRSWNMVRNVPGAQQICWRGRLHVQTAISC